LARSMGFTWTVGAEPARGIRWTWHATTRLGSSLARSIYKCHYAAPRPG
jgi:hypothetical protein